MKLLSYQQSYQILLQILRILLYTLRDIHLLIILSTELLIVNILLTISVLTRRGPINDPVD